MWQLAAKLTRKLPAETAHNLAVFALKHGFAPVADQILLPVRVAGLCFDNPLGLAAGFDKNAEACNGALRLGFGFTETGTITPLPQAGNPRPRLFRLPEDAAVINRYGFNSKGMHTARRNLRAQGRRYGIVGINIGANKASADRVADYFRAAEYLSADADYLCVNISSPNTPGLRDLQHESQIKAVITAALTGRDKVCAATDRPPVFVKLAPDMTRADLESTMDAALDCGINGFILTNTTLSRPAHLVSRHRSQAGGLSGQPLCEQATDILAQAAGHLRATGCRDIALIGAGGIATAEQAYARLLAGADLIQLYTALALQGPAIVTELLRGLSVMLRCDGLSGAAEATGAMPSAKAAKAHAAHIARRAAKLSEDS